MTWKDQQGMEKGGMNMPGMDTRNEQESHVRRKEESRQKDPDRRALT